MRILDPSRHTPRTIDNEGAQKFEAFLNRNFPEWRKREEVRIKNEGLLTRCWPIGVDEINRVAIYRGQYIEIYDRYLSNDKEGQTHVEYPKGIICDIDGDLTPVAVWGDEKPDRQWDDSLLPHYLTGIEEMYRNALAQGFPEPIIVGFELAHEYARDMANEQFGAGLVESYTKEAKAGEPSVLFATLSEKQASQGLSHLKGFNRIRDIQSQGMFVVVFIRDRKSEWVGVPIPETT